MPHGRKRSYSARSPHGPGRCADDFFLVLYDEAELFVELEVFRPVGFEIAGGFFLIEMFDVARHQGGADALSLSARIDADGAEVDMRLDGIEMAPAAVPSDNFRNGFAQWPERGRRGEGNLFGQRQAIGRGVAVHITADRAIDQRDVGLAEEHVAQADAKKQPTLVRTPGAECREVKRIGDEGVGEHFHALVQARGGKFFYFKHAVYCVGRCQ